MVMDWFLLKEGEHIEVGCLQVREGIRLVENKVISGE